MKLTTFRCALISVFALSAAMADSPSVLISGGVVKRQAGRSVMTEGASAIVKLSTGEMRVRAREIEYVNDGNVLKCSGAVVVTSASGTIRGEALTVELGTTPGNVYLLNPAGIVLQRSGELLEKSDDFRSWKPAVAPAPLPADFDFGRAVRNEPAKR